MDVTTTIEGAHGTLTVHGHYLPEEPAVGAEARWVLAAYDLKGNEIVLSEIERLDGVEALEAEAVCLDPYEGCFAAGDC